MTWLTAIGSFLIGLIFTFGFAIATRLSPASSVIEVACCIMTFILMAVTVAVPIVIGILAADDYDAHRRRY